jgi:hypothetical protein
MVDNGNLPKDYPTHAHTERFWENLGRAIATYGFLEEVLSRAIFAITGTREYASNSEANLAFDKWQTKLEKSLKDTLHPLVDTFQKELKTHPENQLGNLPDLVRDLKKAAEYRNVLCHGSWSKPNSEGQSLPRYFNKKIEQWDTPFDEALLKTCQENAAHLASAVMNSVTAMGYAFPGTDGPGQKIRT